MLETLGERTANIVRRAWRGTDITLSERFRPKHRLLLVVGK